MLNTLEEWPADAMNVRGSKTKRTSGYVGLEHSILHMASTQEMKLKLDPESILADSHKLEAEKIYNIMYLNITTKFTKLLQNKFSFLQNQSKFTTHSHLQNYLSS